MIHEILTTHRIPARFTNLFEAHSFTGRGVMQSYDIATALADLITTGRSREIGIRVLAREWILRVWVEAAGSLHST